MTDEHSRPRPILTALHFTDTHHKGVNPRSRIDDYPRAVLQKVAWVVNEALRRKVDVLFHTGDWFDGYNVDASVVGDVMDVLVPARDAGIVIVGVYGQHDVLGYNVDTIRRCSIRLLEASKIITLLRRGQVFSCKGVAVVGCPYADGIDGVDGLDEGYGYYIGEKDGFDRREYQRTILLAHGTLVEHPLPEGFRHTLLEKVNINADIVLSGDYHDGYGVYRRSDGVTFCNPGSLARTKRTKRMPKTALIEVYAKDDIAPGVSIVPVKCAAASVDIFSDEDVPEPANDAQVAEMVAYLERETQVAEYRQFDVSAAIRNLPVEGRAALVSEARSMAMSAVQKAEKQTDG